MSRDWCDSVFINEEKTILSIVAKNGKIYQLELYTDNLNTIDNPTQYTFTITAIPKEAKITIKSKTYGKTAYGSGEVKLIDYSGSEISYTVECEGYDSQSGNAVLNENITEEVTLQIKRYTVEIIDDNEISVKFYNSLGEEVKSDETNPKKITVNYGESISYVISRDGYEDNTGTINDIKENKTITNITYTKKRYTVLVTASPSDADIKLADESGNVIENGGKVESGTKVIWTVSKDHYKTQTGEVIVNENINLEITLERIYVTFAETFNFTSCTNSNYNGLLNGGSTTVNGEIVFENKYKKRDMGYFNISSSDITSKIPEDSNISKITVYYTLSREKKGSLAEAAGPQCKIICDIYTGSTSKGSHTSAAASTSAQQESYSVTNISRSELKNNGMKVDLKSSIKTSVTVKTYVSGLHVVIEGTKPET